jgi:NAD(P)-dependent dehydrogenase (short-subunit alcohol dehydrogenase family)
MDSNDKRVALVTGANRGIGFEIARQLAEKNITVIIGARDEKKGSEARNKLTTRNMDVHFVLLDVTDQMTIQSAIGKIKDNFRRLDILVNNAGISIDPHTRILELSQTLFRHTLETNAFGPLLLSQVCVPLMKENGYGRIVNLSSTLGSLTDIINPESSYDEIQSPAYRLSKTLLNGITVLLAKELRGTNILVNSVCPGWVRTQMGGENAPLTPEQAASAPVWLATLPDDGPTGGFFREHRPLPW